MAESRMNQKGYEAGRDAASIKPKFVPDFELLPRDDSGGPEWKPYTAEFGDGGFVTGDKAHLSARGGKDDSEQGDEINTMPGSRETMRSGASADAGAPAKAKRMSRE